jgi:RimJ/RimL family protein N-acetyltransferase
MADGAGGEEPSINVRGQRVALGPLRRDLLDTYLAWMNDLETMRTQGDLPGPRTADRIARWYEHVTSQPNHAWFTIYELPDLTPIGITWLSDIDHRHRTAGFGISIGEASMRGKGYGTEATTLALDVAFTALGLHNVLLEVYSNNPGGQRAYEKAGFREIGRRHECYLADGRLWDEVYMECLSGWFESPVLGQVFQPDMLRE